MRMHMTALAIDRLQFPNKGQVKYWDEMLPGFGVLVSQRTKSFIIMYGKERRLRTLGKFPQKSLQDARNEAKRLLPRLNQNKLSRAFHDARREYLSECEARVRANTLRQYLYFLNLLDFKGDVSEITRQDIKPYLIRHQATMTYKVFFNWCIRNDILDRNPLAGERAYLSTARTRVLTKDELKVLWQYEDPPFTNLVKLLVLTGQRRHEIANLQPEWIGEQTIIFPASFTKNHREHIFPYGQLTAQYLRPYRFNGWSKSKRRMDEKTGVSGYVLHDLRRTYATIHAELGTPIHITEKLLNHVSGSLAGVAGIYNRHTYIDEMRAAQETYEQRFATMVNT